MNRQSLFGFVIAGIVMCASAQAQGQEVQIARSAVRRGEMSGRDLASIVARVASIAREDTTEIKMHVGDTLSLAEILLVAYDSSGVELGRFRTFDSTIKPGATLVGRMPRTYVAVAEGPAEFMLTFPRVIWASRSDAPATLELKVQVVP